MTDFDSQYFFILKPKQSPKIPFLVPDQNTQGRRFRYEAQPMGSAPLVFHNANKEDNKRARIIAVTPDVLFAGMSILVRTPIRDKLLLANIPHLSMHPSIYIDNDDKWHEDYWHLTFTKEFDCWDREKSEFDDDPMEAGDSQLFQVYSYRLDAELLDSVPLEERRLFRMGGDVHGYVCCHQSLRAAFSGGGDSGAHLKCLSDQ